MLLCCNDRSKLRGGVWGLFIDVLFVIYCPCGSVAGSELQSLAVKAAQLSHRDPAAYPGAVSHTAHENNPRVSGESGVLMTNSS